MREIFIYQIGIKPMIPDLTEISALRVQLILACRMKTLNLAIIFGR